MTLQNGVVAPSHCRRRGIINLEEDIVQNFGLLKPTQENFSLLDGVRGIRLIKYEILP
jgi:hypothetical protein